MADTEKDVNRAAAAPQEEASAAQAAPEAPQPETQDAEKTEKKEKHAEGKAHAELAALKTKLGLLNRIAATLCALLTQYHISVYDEQAHRGLARHIYLRHAVTNGSVLVCLVCNGRSLPHAQDICAALVKAHPEVESVVLNVNTHKTNVITGKECITLYGPAPPAGPPANGWRAPSRL